MHLMLLQSNQDGKSKFQNHITSTFFKLGLGKDPCGATGTQFLNKIK
jgi:hypothetical protein